MAFLKVPSEEDITIDGTSPQLDDTDKLGVSMWGERTVPGDTALAVSINGQLVQGRQRTNEDGVSNGNVCFVLYDVNDSSGLLGSAGYLWNSTTWDRPRANTEITVLASAARTAAVNSADLTNHNARGIYLTIDATADPSGAVITPTIVFKAETISNAYEIIMVLPTINSVSVNTYLIYPGTLTAAANDIVQILQAPLPRTWRLQIAVADSASFTYSAEASYIL